MGKKPRIIITGVSGLLGNNLSFCLKGQYTILGLYHQHTCSIEGITVKSIDLTDLEQVRSIVAEFKPDAIIHCAALSDIEYCEAHQDLAYKANVLATRHLIEVIKQTTCQFIFISTDAIYEQTQGTLINEQGTVHPSNYYALTKLEAEKEALKYKHTMILRTNIFGWNIQDKFSLGEWVIHELIHQNKIKGFTDAEFSSIYTFELAVLIDRAIQKKITGVFNAASRTHLSKYQFACKIAQLFGFDERLIEPISIDEFVFKAKRQKFLGLDVSQLERALNIQCPTLEECIVKFYQDYQKQIPSKIKQGQGIVYPQLNFIPYGRQFIEDDDIQAVVQTLKSGYLTQGPKVAEFEEALKIKTGAQFAVAVNSGTSALHIACLAAGIKAGDEVITSPNSFVASANCIVYCGGTPVFADIDPRTYNISAQAIDEKITKSTKAIIPVHFAGQCCDNMQAIHDIVRRKEKEYGHKIFIIEDASHALGSSYQSKKVGSSAYSDMTVLSFHPVKHITTAEGGAVLTNDEKLCRSLRRFRSHGITNDPAELVYKDEAFELDNDGKSIKHPWYYEQQDLGFNYRITDIQCALGISQINKLERFVNRRKSIVSRYNAALGGLDFLTTPFEAAIQTSNFHLYVLLFDFEKLGISRAQLMLELKNKGIQTQVHYIPIHTQPYYQKKFGYRWGQFPNAENYYKHCLSIPLFAAMKEEEVRKVIETMQSLKPIPVTQ